MLTTRAAGLIGKREFRVGPFEIGTPGLRDVVVRPERTSICGSDPQGYIGKTNRRTPGPNGLIMGHETAGIVEWVGIEVTGLKPGDRVALDSTEYCNQCPNCRRGRTNLCATRKVLGVAPEGEYHRNGAFAQHIIVPEWICHKMPDSLSFDAGAMMEALAVGHAGWMRAKEVIEPGDPVALIGCGNIGKLMIQMILSQGHPVIALNRGKDRLDQAVAYGAQGFLMDEPDVVSKVRKLTDGGPLAVLDVVGEQETYDLGVSIVGDGGRIVLIGDKAEYSKSPHRKLVKRQLDVVGSCAFPASSIAPSLELMASGAVQVEPLITHHCTLDEVPGWFERLGNGEIAKVVVHPQE